MIFLKCTPKVRLVKLDNIVYFNHNQLYFNYFCPQSSSRENIGDSNYYSSVLILNAEWLPKTIAMLQGLSELLWLSFVSTCWQILYHCSVYLYVEGFFWDILRETRELQWPDLYIWMYYLFWKIMKMDTFSYSYHSFKIYGGHIVHISSFKKGSK